MKRKRRRRRRSTPRPKFAVGDVVWTRAAVPVRCPGLRGRRWLWLLPGTLWEVIEVIPGPTPRHKCSYRLRSCGSGVRHLCLRREFTLRPAARSVGSILTDRG